MHTELPFAEVLRRMADPVEPFGFERVQGGSVTPLLEHNRDRTGQSPECFKKADQCPANELQHLHIWARAARSGQAWRLPGEWANALFAFG
jgi:hypothetical protein